MSETSAGRARVETDPCSGGSAPFGVRDLLDGLSRRVEREPPLVECGADDDGRRAGVAEGDDVREGRHAAAGDEGDVDSVDDGLDGVRVDALQLALDVDVGEQDSRGAAVRVAAGGVGGVNARSLGPPFDDDFARLGVERDDDALRMRLRDVGDDVGVVHRRGPEDDAVDAAVEEVAGVGSRSDAAAELNRHVDGVDDCLDRGGVLPLALERTVEVDEVERPRAAVDPSAGGLDRVAVALLGAAFALDELDDLTVLHVDSGDDLERREHSGAEGQGGGKRTDTRGRNTSAERPRTAIRSERLWGRATQKQEMKIFGSSGTRGVVTQELTPAFVLRVAQAAGTVWDGDRAVVSRDTRTSGEMFANAAASGLASAGLDVDRLGVTPTPAVVRYCEVEAVPAVHITASHNPPEYNGVKLVGDDGVELTVDVLEEVEEHVLGEEFDLKPWDEVGSVRHVDSANRAYVDDLLASVDREAIAEAGLKVALDPGHGAGSLTSPEFFRRLGCEVVTVNATPDGHFPGRQPEPVGSHLTDLSRLVRASDADLGVAHDGDADRAVFVDETGEFIDGESSMAALAAAHLSAGDTFVSAVNVSQRVVDAVSEAGASLELTPIGSTNIITHIRALRAKGETVPVAGEGNGGVFFPNYRLVRDGAYIGGKFLELVADRPASEVVAPFSAYHAARVNVHYDSEGELTAMLEAAEAYAKRADVEPNTIDGYRLDYGDAWVLVRPSGTEPVIRIYAEARDADRAESLADEVESALLDTRDGA